MKNRPRVTSLTTARGKPMANQYVIETTEGTYLQSYNVLIAFIPNNHNLKTQLDEKYWAWSNTTSKARNLFLGEKRDETEQKIKNHEYQLVNLNEE